MSESKLTIVDTTGSTNDDVRERARAGAPAGTAVAARVQTSGRGRRGHVWSSPRGSLYLSVALRPQVPMSLFVGVPAVCALGVLDCLRELPGLERVTGIKWPNDILLGEGKVAGVLVEAGSGEGGPFAVCGVGVNLQAAPAGEEAPAAPESPLALARANLADVLAPQDLPSFEELAERLRASICARVDAWARAIARGGAAAGPLGPILNEYFDACPLLGHRVAVLSPEGLALGSGVFAGLDGWGRACVRLDDGREMSYTSEMVSLRAI